MAQHSVHLTQNLQAKPSIFEVVAADSLQSTFQPALKRIAHFITNIDPEKYGWLSRYFDELYLGLNALIQQHYIRIYGGSLAEVFYSLTRLRTKTEKLSSGDKFLAFAFSVLVPYLNSKLTDLITKWKDDCENDYSDRKTTARKKLSIKLFTIAKSMHDCLQVVQYIGYLSDRTKSHSIMNHLIGQQLIYLPAETNLDWSWSDLFSLNFRNSAILTGMMFRGLELSAFFLQFVQWWQNETSNGSLTKLPNPQPPAKHGDAVGRYENICPICLQSWKIPTVNRISGYVFCYKCVVKCLSDKNQCPVTKYASTIDDLIRIYEL